VLALLLTGGNLLLGFLSIGLIMLPHAVGWEVPRLDVAVWCIALAGVLDAIDGPVARRMKSTAVSWGREFDALADLVSFGVAPVVLLGVALPAALRTTSTVIGALYVIAGAWRLARFLKQSPSAERGQFTGMPITAAGLLLAAWWLYADATRGAVHPGLTLGMVAAMSVLMVSRIVYDKFPEFGVHDRRNAVKWVIALSGAVAIAVKPALTGLPIALLYAAHGPVRALLSGAPSRIGHQDGRVN